MVAGCIMAALRTLLLVSIAVGVAGCETRNYVRPLQPVPTGPVLSQPLPPTPDMTVETSDLDAPPTDGEQDVAVATPAAPATVPQASAPPQREDVLGQWTAASGGTTCQVFVTLTGWEGGFRASQRGCTDPTLSQIGAWNIEGNNVVLKDASGNAIATLAKTGAARFDGASTSGGAVSLYR